MQNHALVVLFRKNLEQAVLITNQHIEEIKNLRTKIEDLTLALANVCRPPDQQIMDDVDLRNFLKISKRTAAYLREKSLITYSKIGSKIYYKLSDVLSFLKQHEVPAINSNLKISL